MSVYSRAEYARICSVPNSPSRPVLEQNGIGQKLPSGPVRRMGLLSLQIWEMGVGLCHVAQNYRGYENMNKWKRAIIQAIIAKFQNSVTTQPQIHGFKMRV
jgi:hypothetical protein